MKPSTILFQAARGDGHFRLVLRERGGSLELAEQRLDGDWQDRAVVAIRVRELAGVVGALVTEIARRMTAPRKPCTRLPKAGTV